MKTFFYIFFVWTLNGCASQHHVKIVSTPSEIKFPLKITGVVKDSITQKIIYFANIQIFKNGRSFRGTFQDTDGHFKLTINEPDLQKDYLCVKASYVGYFDKHFDLIINKCFTNDPLTILLNPQPPAMDYLVTIDNGKKALHESEAHFSRDSLLNIELHKYILTLPPCE